MSLPSVEQYSNVIEKKDPSTLSTLSDHNFLFLEHGFRKEYCFSLGTSAAVFKAMQAGRYYAIRCFLRGELETFKRYEQLAAFLASTDVTWKVPFQFLYNEILIDGQFYPAIKMDWVEGTPLNKFIDNYSVDSSALSQLQKKLIQLSSSLEENGVGHGDLKYNNIIIQNERTGATLKLIDYDSMFIPAFKGKKNLETGSPGFQPLKRLSSHFSEIIDRFSIWVMLTTLEAVKVDPTVWTEMEQGGFNNEHSLFSASDFFNPAGSTIFQKLKRYNNEDLNFYLDRLLLFSKSGDLNAIEKPHLYKETFVPASHEKWIPPSAPVAPPPEQWKRYDVEIKTIPSGKDVLVYGVKKGITPLRLSLLKNDFGNIEVVNELKKTPVPIKESVSIYELDFSKKEIPPPPVAPTSPLSEPDEILEFNADRYTVQEGELATINWKVKGGSKIHISNMGEVQERIGTKRVVLKNTTDYVLTVGSKNRSLTINVQPKPRPVSIPTAPVEKETKVVAPAYPSPEPRHLKKQASKVILRAVVIFIVVAAISFFAFNYISNNRAQVTNHPAANTEVPKEPLFTQSSVMSFLNGLYSSYNDRNLSSIMSNYAPSLVEYYDSKSLNKDSLSAVIRDLFITPVSYNCAPDFNTLLVQPQGENCKVVVTINEELKSDQKSKTETYKTTIEYVLNPSYKIISEKSPG